MRTASLWPLAILPQICTVLCVRNCKNILMHLWKCFLTLRLAGLAMHQTTMKTKGWQLQRACKTRWLWVRQQWEQGVRFWVFGPHWSSCHKIKMMQCTLLYCDLWKQNISTCCFPFVNVGTWHDRTTQSFQAVSFNFAQMKASIELCINKLSDAAAKSKPKANCEKFDSELGKLWTPDGLTVSSGMAFYQGTERLANWPSP